MKKNNKKGSNKAFQKHVKNKKRKQRAEALYAFNDLTARVKFMQEYMRKQAENNEPKNGATN
jgi:hypothetical protein